VSAQFATVQASLPPDTPSRDVLRAVAAKWWEEKAQAQGEGEGKQQQ